MTCWTTSSLNNYQKNIDALDAEQSYIDRVSNEMVEKGGSHDPSTFFNFFEALEQEEVIFDISGKIDFSDPLAVGNELVRAVQKYWREKAYKEAGGN